MVTDKSAGKFNRDSRLNCRSLKIAQISIYLTRSYVPPRSAAVWIRKKRSVSVVKMSMSSRLRKGLLLKVRLRPSLFLLRPATKSGVPFWVCNSRIAVVAAQTPEGYEPFSA